MSTESAIKLLNSTEVGFKTGNSLAVFGHPDALGSWFDTICVRLENSIWGSRFPIVMNKLYNDDGYGVFYEDVEEFKLEIATIRSELSKLPLSEAIWDTETPDILAPINHPNLDWSASNLEGFYKNKYKNLYDCLNSAIEFMEYDKTNCFIQQENQILDDSKVIIDGKKLVEDEV